jgi:hypothetical protein
VFPMTSFHRTSIQDVLAETLCLHVPPWVSPIDDFFLGVACSKLYQVRCLTERIIANDGVGFVDYLARQRGSKSASLYYGHGTLNSAPTPGQSRWCCVGRSHHSTSIELIRIRVSAWELEA